MPSTFRASRSGRHLDGAQNRTRTGQIDHDVFEGLPVRRWSRQQHTFSQAPKPDDSDLGVQGPGGAPTLPELPMPRDSQLLPPTSRALLRAARAGCIHIRQGSRAAQDEEKSAVDAEDSAAASHLVDRSFTTRKWMTVPKHLEPAEVEFLAKRRPGLPSLYGATAGTDGGSGAASGPMRRTKFQKTDPETGNISIYEAWVPEGHRIEGEITGDLQSIVEQSSVPVKPEAPAPGTIVEGVGIVNAEGVVVAEAGSAAVMTPPKRRPPPPKRKGRGIGKGRKKKVMFAPGEGADAAAVHGVRPATGNGENGIKDEGQDGSQMSIDQVGQDEDDEDGDEGDDSDEGDESMVDVKTPDTPQPLPGTDSVNRPSFEPPAEQSVDVNMIDVVSDNQPSIPQLSPVTDKETTLESQPILPGASHSEHTSEVDFSALASSVTSKKADVTDLNEKPVILGIDKSIAPTNEPTEVTTTFSRAQNANINPQGKDGATEPTADLALKKEPDFESEQIIPTALQPASPKNNTETPVAQPPNQLQTPMQPLAGVSESEQSIVSNDASIETQESKQSSTGSPLHLNAQEKLPVTTERRQTTSLGIPGANLGSDDAKDSEIGDAPAPEQRLVPPSQSRANPDSLQAPPPTAKYQQLNTTLVEPNTSAEAPTITYPTVADPGVPDEAATAVSEEAKATSQISLADQTVTTRAEPEEESRRKEVLTGDGEPERLSGSVPQTGPSGSM